jgi:hypothetical protein
MKDKQAVQIDTRSNWPDEIRLKMIKKSEFYSGNERMYQYGYYDGYQEAFKEIEKLRNPDTKTITYTEKDFKEMVNGWNEERDRLQARINDLQPGKGLPYQKILGEFIGTLKGVCANEIPEELNEKLRLKIKELEGNIHR